MRESPRGASERANEAMDGWMDEWMLRNRVLLHADPLPVSGWLSEMYVCMYVVVWYITWLAGCWQTVHTVVQSASYSARLSLHHVLRLNT